MISDIFQQSRERDRSRYAKDTSEILYLTPAEQKAAFSYGNLAEFVLDLLASQRNTFCEAMLHFCQQPHDLEEANVQVLRRNYSLSLKPLFDGLEWGLADYLNGETRQTFERIKQGQMETRYIVLSLCHKSQLVRRPLDRPAINSYIETMRRLDRELYEFLLAWSKRRRRQDSNRWRIPFRVLASSESETNPARHIAEEGGGYWESRMDGNVHWVEIQPEAEIPVSQMVVRHHPFLFYITKEFEIQGSHDGRTWTALDRRENNMDAVTTHELREGRYPRYRIYITTPGEIDYSARLEGVELLSRKERA